MLRSTRPKFQQLVTCSINPLSNPSKGSGNIATITLNHPASRNAMTVGMGEEFQEVITRLRKDDSIRATIISDTPEIAQQAIRCFRGGCYPKMTFKLAAEVAQITIDLFAAHGKTISIQIECLEDAEAKITLDKNHSFK